MFKGLLAIDKERARTNSHTGKIVAAREFPGLLLRDIFNESSRAMHRWAVSIIRECSSSCFSYWTFSCVAVHLLNELFLRVDLFPEIFFSPSSGPAADFPGAASWDGASSFSRNGVWSTDSRSRKAQTHSAATRSPLTCSQVSASRTGQWGGATVQPPTLPNHEECLEPHDTLSGWQILPR